MAEREDMRAPPNPCPVLDMRRKPPASRPLPVSQSRLDHCLAQVAKPGSIPDLSDSSASLNFSLDEIADEIASTFQISPLYEGNIPLLTAVLVSSISNSLYRKETGIELANF